MVAALLLQIPRHILLPSETQRTLLRLGLYGVSYCLLGPVAWALRTLDFLDRQRNWTLGYCLLCRRPLACDGPLKDRPLSVLYNR